MCAHKKIKQLCWIALLIAAYSASTWAAPPNAAEALSSVGIVNAALPPVPLTLQWVQGGTSKALPQSPDATYFVVCILAPGEKCATAKTQWQGSATSIPRTHLNPFNLNQPALYRYRLTLPALSAERQRALSDRPVVWQVQACINKGQECATAEATLVFTTRNLEANNISTGSSHREEYHARARVNYSSLTGMASGSTVSRLETYQVFYDANAASCRIDPNGIALPSTAVVLTADGRRIPIGSIPLDANGAFNTTGLPIMGIHDPATMTSQVGESNLSFPSGASEIIAVELTSYPASGPGSPIIDLNDPQARIAWVSIMRVDTLNRVKEINEGDNVLAECHHY